MNALAEDLEYRSHLKCLKFMEEAYTQKGFAQWYEKVAASPDYINDEWGDEEWTLISGTWNDYEQVSYKQWLSAHRLKYKKYRV